MRKNIVAGNWKMNTLLEEGIELASQINDNLRENNHKCDVVICVPATHLTSISGIIDHDIIGLGAENCSEHEKGAYTGEISAGMIASTGATYCILGHSERRQYFGENNEQLAKKVRQALDNGLIPIFCVGEVLEERENGTFIDVVKSQLEAVFTLDKADFSKLIIAYEPVWAIGTGVTATADQADEGNGYVRSAIAEAYGEEAAQGVTIQYGGSMNAGNADELTSKENVDGGLIGGASLKAHDFSVIVKAASK